MSRYFMRNEPTCQIVVGFDPPLRAFFGQVFNPSVPDDEEDLVGGWPTAYGLGIQPRLETEEQVKASLAELASWLAEQQVARNAAALICVRLQKDWRETPDRGVPPILAMLTGEGGARAKLETQRRRFQLGSDDGFYTLSEGNPGALAVIGAITKAEGTSPTALIALLDLDDMNLRGSQIWVAYKDVCGGDIQALIERVRNRDPKLVEAVNRIIPEGERAVTSGASYAHR